MGVKDLQNVIMYCNVCVLGCPPEVNVLQGGEGGNWCFRFAFKRIQLKNGKKQISQRQIQKKQIIHRYNLKGLGYEQALLDCSQQPGQNLIQVSSLANAMEAFEASHLNSGIRIDAVSNKTCFVDQNGMAVDPQDHGFNVSIGAPEKVSDMNFEKNYPLLTQCNNHFPNSKKDHSSWIRLINKMDLLLF